MNNKYFLHSNQLSHTICVLNCMYPYISGLDDRPREIVLAIKLKFDYVFILHKLNNLSLYILCISLHVMWWNICLFTYASQLSNISNVVKLKNMLKAERHAQYACI